ncbi:MAG: hypothetical protein AAF639_00735 [Chloroflexota bacterium]
MGLHYKILWVDDRIENIKMLGLITNIEHYLAELGFMPVIDDFEDIVTAQQTLLSQQYDLILSDYHISEKGNGDTLIRNIRDSEISTEILFYSALPNFTDVTKELYWDRVSFINIVGICGYDELEQKTKWLIDQTLTRFHNVKSNGTSPSGLTNYSDDVTRKRKEEINMILREQIKMSVDYLDDQHLDTVFNIINQFLYQPPKSQDTNKNNKTLVDLFQEIADRDELDISDPVQWQREIRQDRNLPFREEEKVSNGG